MLNDTERKEIFDLIQKYRTAHLRLVDHYKDKRAHDKCEKCSRRAYHYLGKMSQAIDDGMQNTNITDNDIKCFAILVDSFAQMQRGRLLGELQKYAGFDVVSFVGAYNRNSGNKKLFAKQVDVTSLSEHDLEKRVKKIRNARRKIKKGIFVTKYTNIYNVIHDEATELAHAVVNGKLKNNSKEYLKSVQNFLDVAVFNPVDGDVVDRAKSLLDEKINAPVVVGTIVDNILDGPEPMAIIDESNIDNKPKSEPKYRVDKIGGWFKSIKQKISDKHQESQSAKKIEEQQERDVRRETRRANIEQAAAVFGRAVSGAVDNVLYNVGSGVSEIMTKHDELKAKRETAKQNRQIIRDAERVSREHWKELKREEKQSDNKNHRGVFVRVAAGTAAAILLLGGILMCQNNKHSEQKKEPVKKEVKAKPVVQKQEAATVAIDTAYATALVNYYNSALDIIAGAKKDDILTKVNKQIADGNIQTAEYIGAERIAYAYCIYREYGFNIDVLDLAVNGNQKLTDAQMAELNKVIVDAGERGTGVQQMAKQRVESRGGSLGKHSKFENATKAQQRAYLVNRGVLKKAHVR